MPNDRVQHIDLAVLRPSQMTARAVPQPRYDAPPSGVHDDAQQDDAGTPVLPVLEDQLGRLGVVRRRGLQPHRDGDALR